MMRIDISPFDTFFFRDARPFTMGDDNAWVESIFPPAPSVIYGALRALFLTALKKINLPKKELDIITNSLAIKGIFLDIDGILYIANPFTLMKNSDMDDEYILLEPKTKTFACKASIGAAFSLKKEDENKNIEDVKGGLINIDAYQAFLTSKKIPQKTSIKTKYLETEAKTGIKRLGLTQTTEEGHLYRVDMQRFKNAGLKEKIDAIGKFTILFDFEGIADISIPPIIRLGGEGKLSSVNFDTTNLAQNEWLASPSSLNKNFNLYVSTPAFFEKGWIPKWLDETTLEGSPKESIRLKLIAANTDKPISLGGFDMREVRPKFMRKYVPAGAVYHFEILEGTSQEIINTFHFKSISEGNTAKEGFGITYIGI